MTTTTETILRPSPQQEAIIDWTQTHSGNLMINALAGTGKSSVLRMLIPHLQGSVYVGAFAKPIEAEWTAWIKFQGLQDRVVCKTVHATGLGAYRYGGGNRNTRVELNKMRLLIEDVAKETKDSTFLQYEKFILKLTGFAKRAGVGVLVDDDAETTWTDLVNYYSVDLELPALGKYYTEADEERRSGLVQKLIPYASYLYNASLEECPKLLDYDDMQLAALYYKCRFTQYDWVLIDEVQDLSAIRREIAIRSMKQAGRMVAVGDRFQNIMGFSGSEHDAMDILKDRMKMSELPLTVSYRNPRSVISIANTWVPELEARPDAPDGITRSVLLEPSACKFCKEGYVGKGDDEKECDKCGGTGKSGPSFWTEAPTLSADDVVLCRNNRPIIELAYELLRRGVPCQIEGRNFASSLIKLCQRWKLRTLDELEDQLGVYRDKQVEKLLGKKDEGGAARLEDKIDTLITLLGSVRSSGKSQISDLVDKINLMFGDTDNFDKKPKVLTLSTVHKCVHPMTLVETSHGYERILDIHTKGKIAAPEGPKRYIGKFLRRFGKTVRIETKRGYSLETSPDHGMSVWRDGAMRRVESSDILVGDWLRLRLGRQMDGDNNPMLPAAPTALDVRSKAFRIPTSLTVELAEFLGLMVADGTVYKNGFRLVKRYKSVTDRFTLLVSSLFGCNSKEGHNYENSKTYRSEVYSAQISEWLRSIGGLSPNKKAVPECIMRATVSIQAAFLRGLFEDGTVNLKNQMVDHIHWDNYDPILAETVHVMLLGLGIVSSLKHRKSAVVNGKRRPISTIYLYSDAVSTFRFNIGFVAPEKNARLTKFPVGIDRHLVYPITKEDLGLLKPYLTPAAYQNAKSRGYISRRLVIANWGHLPSHWHGDSENILDWVYLPVSKLSCGKSETYCVEVPNGGRFIQNGFDGWNSKGREWPKVYILGRNRYMPSKWAKKAHEIQAEKNLSYVAVTRSKNELIDIIVPEESRRRKV